MTITEAKKIIELCADAVTKTTGEETKIYVNKDYILQILDMVEEPAPIIWPEPDYPYPWHPTNPGVTYTDKHWVWRKVSTGTGENDPGEWHLVYEKGPDPYTPWCNDPNSTGYYPGQPDIHVTCDDTVRYASSDSSMYKDNGTTTTISSNSEPPVDVSPKRTDFIEDFVPNGTVSK